MLNEFNNEDNNDVLEVFPEVETLNSDEYPELKEDLEDKADKVEDLATELKIEEPVIEKPVDKKPVVEKKTAPLTKSDSKSEKVAVHSTRNVTWHEVGKVYIGYNIVTPEAAEKWLTRDHIRLATPEEVAKEFGI